MHLAKLSILKRRYVLLLSQYHEEDRVSPDDQGYNIVANLTAGCAANTLVFVPTSPHKHAASAHDVDGMLVTTQSRRADYRRTTVQVPSAVPPTHQQNPSCNLYVPRVPGHLARHVSMFVSSWPPACCCPPAKSSSNTCGVSYVVSACTRVSGTAETLSGRAAATYGEIILLNAAGKKHYPGASALMRNPAAAPARRSKYQRNDSIPIRPRASLPHHQCLRTAARPERAPRSRRPPALQRKKREHRGKDKRVSCVASQGATRRTTTVGSRASVG